MDNLSKREKLKLTHEKQLIEAAEKILCQKGFENASMDEIAQAAQFTKRTVYQHFRNKEDLYFAVALKGYQQMLTQLKKADKKDRTGYEKLEGLFHNFSRFCKENPELYRLISSWSHIGKDFTGDNNRLQELQQWSGQLAAVIQAFIETGKEDGSIQQDTDSNTTAYSLVFLSIGFFNQLSVEENIFQRAIEMNKEEFGSVSIDLAIKGLKRSKVIASARKGTA